MRESWAQLVAVLSALPKEFFFVALIEVALVTATTVLLAQPDAVFAGQSERFKGVARAGGWVCLCLLFCWSVILGGVISLHQIQLPEHLMRRGN